MKSELIGIGTSAVEVLNVSPHGFWLRMGDREVFLDFQRFPWFRTATLDQLFTVERLHADHVFWPGLDVDLNLDRIENPDRYPLVAKASLTAPAA